MGDRCVFANRGSTLIERLICPRVDRGFPLTGGWAELGTARVSEVTPDSARDGGAAFGIAEEYYIYSYSTIK